MTEPADTRGRAAVKPCIVGDPLMVTPPLKNPGYASELKETTKFQAIVQKQTKEEITAQACIHTGFHCFTEIDQIFQNN